MEASTSHARPGDAPGVTAARHSASSGDTGGTYKVYEVIDLTGVGIIVGEADGDSKLERVQSTLNDAAETLVYVGTFTVASKEDACWYAVEQADDELAARAKSNDPPILTAVSTNQRSGFSEPKPYALETVARRKR